MLLTVTWPAKRAVDLDREGVRRACARLARAAAAPAPGRRSGAARRPAGRSRPRARASRRCARRTRRARPARRASASGRSVTSPLAQPAAGQPGQWSLPTICSTACTSTGLEHGEAVLHPAARAGQVDDQALPDDAGQAAGQHGGRHALRDAVGADRLGDAGHLAVEQRPGHLGGAVGRGQAGAAGGEHHPGAAVDGRARSPRRPGRRPVRRPGAPTSKPQPGQEVDDQRTGRVGVDPGGGAVRGDDDGGGQRRGSLRATSPRTCRRSWSRPGRR